MILSWENSVDVEKLLSDLDYKFIVELYHDCLGEGYYKNPAYGKNFSILRDKFLKK